MPPKANQQTRKKPLQTMSKKQPKPLTWSPGIHKHKIKLSASLCHVISTMEKNSMPRHIKFSDLTKQAQEISAAFSCCCHICNQLPFEVPVRKLRDKRSTDVLVQNAKVQIKWGLPDLHLALQENTVCETFENRLSKEGYNCCNQTFRRLSDENMSQ